MLTLLVLNAYGAAMIGRLTSLPMTFVGALILGLCQELPNVSWLWPDGDVFLRLRLAIPGIFLVLAVLFVPSFRLSAGRVVGRDQPPVPTCAARLWPVPCSSAWSPSRATSEDPTSRRTWCAAS